MTGLAILPTVGPIPTIRALVPVIPIAAPVIAPVPRRIFLASILVLALLIRTSTGTIIVSLRAIATAATIARATIPSFAMILAIRPCRITWPPFKSFFARAGRLGRLVGFAGLARFASFSR